MIITYENHVARFHRHVDRISVSVKNLEDPILFHILCNINNARAHKWESVRMRTQDGTFGVNANAIETRSFRRDDE
jgi:hypothetical protein